MNRESLDTYDVLPKDMINYLSNYGRHFNRKLLRFAVEGMYYEDPSTGELKQVTSFTKEEVDNILQAYNIKLKNNQLYDYVYVACMCKADFYGKSVPDDHHFALYIKDVIDDPDAYDGVVFNRWYADTRRKGIAIDWSSMI